MSNSLVTNPMTHFLLYIGLYNILGAFLMMSMHSEKIADSLLLKFTEIIAQPYVHGPFGRLWLWWVATTNLFLGAIMLLATRWEPWIQHEICLAVVGVYVIMYLVMIIGGSQPKYGRGIYVTYVLWFLQIAWGSYVAWIKFLLTDLDLR